VLMDFRLSRLLITSRITGHEYGRSFLVECIGLKPCAAWKFPSRRVARENWGYPRSSIG
jgi:hypothetical protein